MDPESKRHWWKGEGQQHHVQKRMDPLSGQQYVAEPIKLYTADDLPRHYHPNVDLALLIYMPNCPYCRKMAGDWENFAGLVHRSNIFGANAHDGNPMKVLAIDGTRWHDAIERMWPRFFSDPKRQHLFPTILFRIDGYWYEMPGRAERNITSWATLLADLTGDARWRPRSSSELLKRLDGQLSEENAASAKEMLAFTVDRPIVPKLTLPLERVRAMYTSRVRGGAGVNPEKAGQLQQKLKEYPVWELHDALVAYVLEHPMLYWSIVGKPLEGTPANMAYPWTNSDDGAVTAVRLGSVPIGSKKVSPPNETVSRLVLDPPIDRQLLSSTTLSSSSPSASSSSQSSSASSSSVFRSSS